MSGVFETRQVAECADVGEIHFWSLDEPFPDIGKVGAWHDHLVGGLENGEPGLDGVNRYSEVPGNIGQIH